MPSHLYYWGTDMAQIRDIIKQFGTTPMRTYPFCSVYRQQLYLRYLKGVKVFKPLNYIPYTKQLAVELLAKSMAGSAIRRNTLNHASPAFTRILASDPIWF